MEEAFLTTAGSDAELAVIEGILRAENILMIAKYRAGGGIASIYTGFSVFGVDIYVAADDLQRAREALGLAEGEEKPEP